jgi:hypothetical protein
MAVSATPSPSSSTRTLLTWRLEGASLTLCLDAQASESSLIASRLVPLQMLQRACGILSRMRSGPGGGTGTGPGGVSVGAGGGGGATVAAHFLAPAFERPERVVGDVDLEGLGEWNG